MNLGTQYSCRVIQLSKMIVSPQGIIKPLCDTCLSKDCGNPIQKELVSIMGITEEMKVWKTKNNIGIVVNCEGYINK